MLFNLFSMWVPLGLPLRPTDFSFSFGFFFLFFKRCFVTHIGSDAVRSGGGFAGPVGEGVVFSDIPGAVARDSISI